MTSELLFSPFNHHTGQVANTRTVLIAYCAFLILLLSSCSMKQEELSGIYVGRGLKNNIDTLSLSRTGTYARALYAQRDHRLLFRNSGNWKRSDNNRIILYDFLPDEDEAHEPQEVLGLGTMTCDFPTRKRSSKLIIEFQVENDAMYYEKL